MAKKVSMFRSIFNTTALACAVLVNSFLLSGASIQPVLAGSCGQDSYIGFPTWYKGLTCDDNGTVQISKGDEGFNQIWTIVLNFVGMLVVAAGYVAAGFFMWGGFNYIISTGDPGKVAAAKNTLLNSVVGLVIALASVGILDFVQKAIFGAAQ